MEITKIDYFTFMQCKTLANLDKEFRFTDGIKINSEWYPMPKFGRDLILQLDPNETNRPIKQFDFNSYAKGFDIGYNRPMILTNEKHLLNAAKCNLPAYFVSDGIAEKKQCSDFGFSVGKCYQSWEYICHNIQDFITKQKDFSFSDLLLCDTDKKKSVIEKIKQSEKNTPKKIYIILKSLSDGGLLSISTLETVYRAYFNEFGYNKNYDTLKRGLNQYDWTRTDKKHISSIDTMKTYLCY